MMQSEMVKLYVDKANGRLDVRILLALDFYHAVEDFNAVSAGRKIQCVTF